MNRGYKGINIVGREGMWKVIFCQTGCSDGLTSRLGWVVSSSREQTVWPAWNFCPVVNSWRNALASGMLGTCALIWQLAAASHSRDPAASPCFFAHTWAILHTFSHTLPLHNFLLNTRFLMAKIQANLSWRLLITISLNYDRFHWGERSKIKVRSFCFKVCFKNFSFSFLH